MAYATRETSALAEYKNGDYGSINLSQRQAAAMQARDFERYRWACKHADALSSAISGFRLPAAMEIYRGFNWVQFHQAIRAGSKSFTELGFTSTSLSKHIGHGFADISDPAPVKCTLHVPAGIQAAYIEPARFGYAGDSGEAELVLQRGILYLVHQASFDSAGVLWIIAEARKL